ncbi:hypothetical protein QN277_016582 [Acacia crassicarpa]|uniref:C2H2-type domain-containing protein n=1 Tax=Acacia crassicarpa TaxID=499986 RepID=A0AAE1MWW7_9FABA|nr:hypothetical protein QN277_016582 [Acacia crassicarpa]
MREKPFSSYSKLHERKSKIKINGASIAALGLGSGSSVRVCDFCGKQFNSGKALGGHRRHHILAQRKMKEQQQEKINYILRIKTKNSVIHHNYNNNLMKSKIGNPNCSSWIRFHCPVCDKDFPSEKSLCGHMRNHPDRDWRGLNPPFTSTTDSALASSASSSSEEFMREKDHQNHKSNNNGSSSSTSGESLSVPVDVSSSCSESSSLKKDMRGRKSIGEAEAAHVAAQILMDIHLYGHSQLRAGLTPREPTPEAAQLPVKKRKNNMMNNNVGGSSSSPSGKQSLDNRKEKLEGSDGNEELEAENNMWDMKVIDLIKEKKKLNMKKRKLGTEMIKSEGEPLIIRTVKQEEVKPSQSYVCDYM